MGKMKLCKPRRTLLTVLACILIMGMNLCVYAKTETETAADSVGNVFSSGEDVVVEDGRAFSAFMAGKTISVKEASAEEDFAIAGMNLSVSDCAAGGSAYLAGMDIQVSNTTLSGNLLAAGKSIELTDVTVKGVVLAGEKLSFSGVAGALTLFGDTVVIDGYIAGDVLVEATKLIVKENTVITGTLTAKTNEEPDISTGASIGDTKLTRVEKKAATQAQQKSTTDKLMSKGKSLIYWCVAMILVGAVLCWLMNPQLELAASMLVRKPAQMLLYGLLVLIAAPIFFVILCVTVVGAPAAGMGIGVYTVALFFATAFTGASVGALLLPKLNRFLSAGIGIAVLEVCKMIPYVKVLVSLFAAIYVLGFIILALSSQRGKHADIEHR